MKNLFLTLLFCLSLISCSAQKTTPKPVYRTVATVSDISGDRAMLSAGKYSNYSVPNDSLELFKEYVFWMDIVDCGNCPTKKAVILDKVYTTSQVQKDQEAAAKKLSNRAIIAH